MVVLESGPALIIASVVWIAWRILVWRSRRGDPLREVAVTALFVWSLMVVHVTLFPLKIIFYDWHITMNLVPLASIRQLVTQTALSTALTNIAGNVVMFVPLGILLPLLFVRLRSAWPLVWRAAAVSIAIELTQVITRARAVDIDDVLLNTSGAVVGWLVFRVVAAAAKKARAFIIILDRCGAAPAREPLLLPLVPIGVAAAITVPLMLAPIIGGTLGEGPDGIVGFAVADWPDSSVVHQLDIAEHTFLVVSEGPPDQQRLRLVDFERVLPGRYTWVATGEAPAGRGSRYGWSITAWNTARDELPTVVVWGSNQDDAASVTVSGNGIAERLELPVGPAFAVGFQYDIEAHNPSSDVLGDFEFTFLDASGTDVTNRFEPIDR